MEAFKVRMDQIAILVHELDTVRAVPK